MVLAVRIMVTGAGGFVGRHLLADLAGAGHEVIAASHRPFEAPAASGVEIFDMRDPPAVAGVLERHRPEAVLHLAAQASVRRSWQAPAETYETNVIGASNLLEALKREPTTRVLLVGSAQEYGAARVDRPLREDDPLHPASPYAVSKVAQELVGLLYHRELGIPALAARPFNHTGPGQSEEYVVGAFCSQIAQIERRERSPVMRVGRLDSRRDFLDVRDVVRAYRLLIESGEPGEAYNVASGEAHRIGDLLKLLLDAAGLAGEVEIVEDAAPRGGDPDLLAGDGSKIGAAVGWAPRITIEQSLLDTLDWYREARPRRGAGP